MNILLLEGLGSLSKDLPFVFTVVAIAVVFFGLVIAVSKRYKRCPSNRVLVIYGKTKSDRVSRPIHGGGAFVMPLIQDFEFLSLDPMLIEIPLEGALSLENIRVSVPSVFTVAIGTESEIMTNASVRLLGLSAVQIMKQAEDIIFGQLRQVIASMRIEEINRDRDVFRSSILDSLEPELRKVGLILINVNIKDITDESGYIEAIGKKAAAIAINQALVDVAVQEKLGAIGIADAERERTVAVAEQDKARDIGTNEAERERAVRIAELEKERLIGERAAEFQRESAVREEQRAMRIRVADAEAEAVDGENKAKASMADANSALKVREADAYQRAETREREAEAGVLEAQYIAEARAAEAKATMVEAEKRSELEAVSRAEKAKTIVDAEAHAAMRKIEAEADAAATYARLEAQARGEFEMLAKKGEGLKRIVESCGGSQEAFQMLMLEHIDHLSETAAKAISNIKFDKVIVWDGGEGKSGGGAGGGNAAANFVRGMGSSLPPMLQIMKDIGGVEMPEFFGKMMQDDKPEEEPAEALEEGQAGQEEVAVEVTPEAEADEPKAS